MTSVIYFRSSSATAALMEPVNFTGQQLRLLDLKRAIVEQKKMSSAMDFDLKITDAEDKTRGAYRRLLLLTGIEQCCCSAPHRVRWRRYICAQELERGVPASARDGRPGAAVSLARRAPGSIHVRAPLLSMTVVSILTSDV